MRLVFDLDECLVSTRRAHDAAFRAVGITMPTDENKFMPARFWLGDKEAYARKKEVFPQFAHMIHRLPALDLLCPGSVILTGTSEDSLAMLLQIFPELERASDIRTRQSWQDKLKYFHENPEGVYFDDWTWFVKKVRRETRWQAIDVSGF